MIARFDLLSINHTTAKINLLEALKASKHQDYPVCMKKERKIEAEEPARNTHAYNREEIVEGGKTKQAENSFVRDARKQSTNNDKKKHQPKRPPNSRSECTAKSYQSDLETQRPKVNEYDLFIEVNDTADFIKF